MPYVDRWAARIRQPGQFDRIRTELDAFGDGIDVLWGIDDDETYVQAIRFDSNMFSRAEVVKWLADHEDSQTGKPYKAIMIEAPLKEASIGARDNIIAISAATVWTPVSAQEVRDGAVHQRFKKELMKVGDYEQSDGSGFTVTMADLRNWVRVSKQMHSNGVRIPVSAGPIPHEDVSNPENSIGEMVDEFVDGNSLFVILDIVGADNIEKALANDVSIYSPVEFTDGKGRVYQQPITHVAITPNPLVPGLEGWEIAASLVTSKAGKEKGMWKKIAKALGLSTEEMTDENAVELILAGIKELKQAHKEELKEAKKAKKASLEDDGVQELVDAEVAKKTAEIKAAMKAGDEREADPMMVKIVGDNRKMKLDALVAACRITPDVRKKLEDKYGVKTAIAASLKKGDDGSDFDFMMEVLSENDPVELTEKSGAQIIKAALGDPHRGNVTPDEKNPLLKDAARRAESAKK